MKRKMAVLTVLGLLCSLLYGCNAATEQPEDQQSALSAAQSAVDSLKDENGEINISYVGIIFPQLDAPWFVAVKDDIVNTLEAAGVKTEVVSFNQDQARQLELIENFGTKGVDGLILFPAGDSGLGTTLEKLQQGGVRVVVFINSVDKGYDAMLLTDYQKMGEMCAEMAAEWIDKTYPDAAPGSVEVGILSIRVSPETNATSDGMNAITQYTDKAKVVVEYEATFDNAQPKAQENTELMFVQHPNVKVILAYNYPLVVDEVVMREPGLDIAKFAVFSNTYDQPVVERIALSRDNKSSIRGITGAGYGSWTYIADAMLGDVELNQDNIAWDPLFIVTADNVEEYLN